MTIFGWLGIGLVVAVAAVMVVGVVATIPGAASGFGLNGARDASSPASTCAQLPVPLGSAESYAALAYSAVTNTGPTILTGNLGLYPDTASSVTGFPPGTFTGTENAGNSAAQTAQADLTIAYNNAAARTCTSEVKFAPAENLAGLTLVPGLYESALASSVMISGGDLTLSGNGVYVFQIGSTLTTGSGAEVILAGGAQAGNVFWQIGSSATLGSTSVMQGTIMAYASISLDSGAILNGGALAETGAVTFIDNTVTVPTTPTTIPTLDSVQPAWNSGNLCSSISYPGPGDVTCVSLVSQAPTPLWYNFSAGKVQGGTVTVTVYGSADCINLNFHSFYTTIVIDLLGSDYSCPSSMGGHGVNVVVNSEGDSFTLNQYASTYTTNVTFYGTTTYASTLMDGSYLNTTVTYIGWSPETNTCPSGITAGRVAWSEVSFGSYNTFNTIFVDGTNVHMAPANYAYSTEPLLPPDGNGYGYSDVYGNETTQTAPAGACSYLGV